MKTSEIMKALLWTFRRITWTGLAGVPILALAQALPPPVDTGRIDIEAEHEGSSVVASQDYRPPVAFAYYSVLGEKLGATVAPPALVTVQTVTVPAQPPVDGQVTIQFVHDPDYPAKHPTDPLIYAGWEPNWDARVTYAEAKLTRTWQAGAVNYELEAKAQANSPAELMTGRGFARLFANDGGPSSFPVLIDGTAVIGATRGFGTLFWWPPRVPYRFLPGTAYYFFQDQADGRRVVYNVLHHRRVGDLREFYPIGELITIGTPGSLGSPAREETYYESTPTTLSEGAAAAELHALMEALTFEANRFEPISDPTVEYAFTPDGAHTSKLRYKLQIQPGLVRTITWAETFTPEGESDPVDYQFFSETVSASATETAAHVIDPFEQANSHRFGSRRGVYRIVPFEAAVTGDTNGDNRIVPPVSPVTPYRVEFADATPLGGDLRFQPNVNDDVDTQSEDPSSTEGGADYANQRVDGADDLASFTPVYLELGQLLNTLSPNNGFSYRLKQADGALNFVYTNLTQKKAFDFRMNPDSGFGPGFDQPARAAFTQQITAAGVDIFAGDTGSAAFRDHAIQNQGAVILIEARQTTTQPLVLEVSREGQVAITLVMPLTIVSAQLLVDANRDGEIKADGSDATSAERPFRFWVNDDDDGDPTDENEVYPVTAKDCDDFAIHGRRDLEDMARLHVLIGGLSDAIAADNPSIYVGLKWKNTTGSPSVNIFPAVETDGGTKYLTDTATATQQAPASTLRTTVLTRDNQYNWVDTNGTFVFDKDFWTGLSSGSPKKYLLFEGCTEGQGELVLVLLRPDGTEIGEGPGVWIDLKNIKSMYQRVKVTPRDPSGIPAPFLSGTTFDANGSGTEPSDDGYPFAAPADEAKTALVFVHGSNIPYEEARWNAETMLKRLWWQGYKGRFVLFYWDTLIGPWDGTIPAHYNLNEYRALKYGWALKNYVESALPSDYAHNVVGHSMGNAVITSALRAREAVNGSTIRGMAARNVVFMQAAIPASCFDSGAATLAELAALESPQTTPDGVGQKGYRGVIETGVNATLFNIYNENDYALGWWVTNQRLMKPEDLLYRGYARKYTWTTTGGGQLWDWSSIEAGPVRMRYLEDLSESMSFVARSRTAALGRMNVGGSISNNLNISEGTELDFGRDRPDHSGEFTRRIQQLGPFYRYLFERAR